MGAQCTCLTCKLLYRMREAAFDHLGEGKSGVTVGSMGAVREYESSKEIVGDEDEDIDVILNYRGKYTCIWTCSTYFDHARVPLVS